MHSLFELIHNFFHAIMNALLNQIHPFLPLFPVSLNDGISNRTMQQLFQLAFFKSVIAKLPAIDEIIWSLNHRGSSISLRIMH